MKKVLICLLAVVILLSGCSAKKENNFYAGNWGDSLTTVRKNESAEPFFESEDLLLYTGTVETYETETYYHFENGALVNGQYKILIGQENTLDDCAAYYLLLRDDLIARYGQPLDPEFKVWLTDDTSYYADRYGVSLYAHRLAFRQEWKTETSYYLLVLYYKDLQTTFSIYACDINHDDLATAIDFPKSA